VVPHEIYFKHCYHWIKVYHLDLVDVQGMQSQFESQLNFEGSEGHAFCSYEGFAVGETHCFEPSIWLLAAVTMSLNNHISPKIATNAMTAEVFDQVHLGRRESLNVNRYYSHEPGKYPLQVDLDYLGYFARTRGMHCNLSNDRVAADSLSPEEAGEIFNLLDLLIGRPISDSLFPPQHIDSNTKVKIKGKAGDAIIQSLLRMRLGITWDSE